MAKKHTLNNLNCVSNALGNGSGAPGSNTLIFGSEIFIATERVDHAHSTVVCARLCSVHLETGRFSAVARRQLSLSSPAASAAP